MPGEQAAGGVNVLFNRVNRLIQSLTSENAWRVIADATSRRFQISGGEGDRTLLQIDVAEFAPGICLLKLMVRECTLQQPDLQCFEFLLALNNISYTSWHSWDRETRTVSLCCVVVAEVGSAYIGDDMVREAIDYVVNYSAECREKITREFAARMQADDPAPLR